MTSLRPHGLDRRLRWLTVGRLGVSLCGMAALLLAHADALPLRLAPAETAAYHTLLAACAVNLVYLVILGRFRNLVLLAWIQILADIVLESLLVYHTGVESVFAYLYFASVIAAAMVLSRRASLLVASFATILLATAFLAHFLQARAETRELTVAGPLPRLRSDLDALFIHLFIFALSLHLVALLAGRLAAEVRRVRILHDEILQAMEDGVVTVDRDGRVTYANGPARRLLGLSGGEALDGRPLESLQQDPVIRALQETLLDGRSIQTSVRLRRPDGTEASIDLQTSVLEDAESRLRGVSAILHDATLREQIVDMEKRAERLRTVAELGATLAHEIRNPLASVRGAAQALRDEPCRRPEESRLLAVIVRESDRLEALVDNFLRFARHKPPTLAPVGIPELLQEVAALLRARPDARDVALRVDAEGAGDCRCDADQMKQVLLNLGLNALEAFAERKGEPATLALRASRSDSPGRIRIVVADNGPGIDPSHWDHLFEPFFSTKPRGTGMGLAIARRIVEAHAGSLTFDTEPGKGTRFCVELRLDGPADAAGERRASLSPRFLVAAPDRGEDSPGDRGDAPSRSRASPARRDASPGRPESG